MISNVSAVICRGDKSTTPGLLSALDDVESGELLQSFSLSNTSLKRKKCSG